MDKKIEIEKNAYDFIEAVEQFDFKFDSIDHVWEVIFPDKKEKWHHMYVVKSCDTYYLSLADEEICSLEIVLRKSIQVAPSFGRSAFNRYEESPVVWEPFVTAAHAWLRVIQKDWIKANKKIQENYPLRYRLGFVPSALVRASISDISRIDQELGKTKTKQFIRLVESGYFNDDKNTTRETMTANVFFDYCKIAYIAGQREDDHVNKKLSGREMYKCYADGRDEGLLEIKPDSEKEFSDWIDGKHAKKTGGGHPWEIKRGGNTTHIDLIVMRPNYSLSKKFQVMLRGRSFTRLKETICMFLGIYEAGFPITIDDPIGIRKRLLALDNIGIIPKFDSLHRANQRFDEDENVYDVLYFDDLGRYKTRIKPFITWRPLPILKPHE